MLGWNILLTKRTVGGLFGYESEKVSVSRNEPSSKGVSAVASQSRRRRILKQQESGNGVKGCMVYGVEPGTSYERLKCVIGGGPEAERLMTHADQR